MVKGREKGMRIRGKVVGGGEVVTTSARWPRKYGAPFSESH